MDLRLTVNREATATAVHVDGRLTADGVHDLESTVAGAAGPVVLDLTNLLSVDDAGVAALRLLTGRGVQLRGTSPYVSLLLREDQPGTRGKRAGR
jgi:anti-anti-sigma regulatory factor